MQGPLPPSGGGGMDGSWGVGGKGWLTTVRVGTGGTELP